MRVAEQRSSAEVAVFDFDGTITARDSLLPFLRHVVPGFRLAFGSVVLMPTLVRRGLGMVSGSAAKEAVLGRFLAGMAETELHGLGESFALNVLPQLVRPAALKRIEWHRQQGHHLVLVSASLEAYLEPWGRQAGFDDVLATRLESSAGRLTGRFAGPNCRGPEKVVRLRMLLGSIDGAVIHAYGDSQGDRELLAIAAHPHFRELNPG